MDKNLRDKRIEHLNKYRPKLIELLRKNTCYKVKSMPSTLYLNYYCYKDLGEPKSLKIKVDPFKGELTLTPDNLGIPVYVREMQRHAYMIFDKELKVMPGGSYEPIGGGVYKLVDA